MNDQEFIEQVKVYIEGMEIKCDGEWGDSRNLEELIRDNMMPQLYQEVLKRLSESTSA